MQGLLRLEYLGCASIGVAVHSASFGGKQGAIHGGLCCAQYIACVCALEREGIQPILGGNTGQVVVNLARLVEKKAFTLRTLASSVNSVWLMAK